MRVVQIIDSLELGGAERMAVNYANGLSKNIDFSGLIATRKEGGLINQIDSDVAYLFLQRKKSVDLNAVLRLRKYLVKNKIDIMHAHSSSFFIAVLVKLTLPRLKIFWHDHYGTRSQETKKENIFLVFLSTFFSSIFVVNLQLKEWNEKNLNCSNVIFIPNFTKSHNVSGSEQLTDLKGSEGKRIVFLANLKNPKNHLLILKAYAELKLFELDWSLHLIGRDYFDSYSEAIKDFINAYSLERYVYLYGEKGDIKNILSQASVGVLASTQEGFPVTLLEYALENVAVVSTNVGYCSLLIENENDGLLFDPFSELEVKNQLKKIIEDESLRNTLVEKFKTKVLQHYSEEAVIEKLILAYKKSK
ncbi:Glycosyltransferase involved in cell wall bisynthesis [Flavobacterium aquidurense]|uniref:Alpha-1,4-N-acetylgalactosamine transferase n=1 Tax=Flavobacterium frigidimaris TaxID=262320 RepID=A0ABX4BUI3_FLAFR|nr:glycosyltransferase [Flavobacterium frigidimaris]OXA81480.1 alpha-1,4-N-acetylgalactosamine transferase [Flavobacterium frigidimaris]SDZ05531.1 Glycosyltransferase involved in cell wall bisynthesis [Flavobacterium aquidurense]